MITDELRKYVQSWRETPNLMDDLDAGDIDGLLGDFEHIADRIDAEHEKAMSEQPCTIDMVPMTDERMAEHGWVRLPVDASGMPIRVGDDVEEVDCDSHGKVFELRLCENEWWVISEGICRRPHRYRHYTPPAVEDVLTDFARLYDSIGGRENEDELWETLLTEYSAKLQLKEDE